MSIASSRSRRTGRAAWAHHHHHHHHHHDPGHLEAEPGHVGLGVVPCERGEVDAGDGAQQPARLPLLLHRAPRAEAGSAPGYEEYVSFVSRV